MPESTLKTSTWTTIAHWNSLIWNASGNNSTANLHRISAEAPTLVHRMYVCVILSASVSKNCGFLLVVQHQGKQSQTYRIYVICTKFLASFLENLSLSLLLASFQRQRSFFHRQKIHKDIICMLSSIHTTGEQIQEKHFVQYTYTHARCNRIHR